MFAHDEETLALAWSELGDTLASSSRDGRVCVWNMHVRSLAESLTFADVPLALEFALNGRISFSGVSTTLDSFAATPLTEIAAYRIDGSLDPHRSPLTLDRFSRLATSDSSNQTRPPRRRSISLACSVSRKSRTLLRAAAVSIFGESGSGRTNLVSALTNRPFAVTAVSHSLETHPFRLPPLESPKGEEIRDIAFWDVPSTPGRTTARSSSASMLENRRSRFWSWTSRPQPRLCTIPNARAATRRLYEGISLTKRPFWWSSLAATDWSIGPTRRS